MKQVVRDKYGEHKAWQNFNPGQITLTEDDADVVLNV